MPRYGAPIEIADTDCPDVNAIRTNTTLPVALVMFSAPNVIVFEPDNDVPVENLSPDVNAQPLEPLPPLPVSEPGTPDPPYVIVQSNHPFNPDAVSIPVPGAATVSYTHLTLPTT